MPRTDETLLSRAKQMRTEMTAAEASLWYRLRAKRLGGIKFVRQSVRRPFIADFVSRSCKLIIEVDGDTHGISREYDAARTARLQREGYRVLRFSNADVMTNEEGVLTAILDTLSSAPLPSADFVGSLPLPGGEREKHP